MFVLCYMKPNLIFIRDYHTKIIQVRAVACIPGFSPIARSIGKFYNKVEPNFSGPKLHL